MREVDREVREELGVGATQIAALLYLLHNDGAQPLDLARELFRNKSAISTLVDRMSKAGLLTKRASSTDGRSHQLFLTAEGRKIADQALPLIEQYDRQLCTDFSGSELLIVTRFLNAVQQRCDRQNADTQNFFKSWPSPSEK